MSEFSLLKLNFHMSPTVGDVLMMDSDEEIYIEVTKHFIRQWSPTTAIADCRWHMRTTLETNDGENGIDRNFINHSKLRHYVTHGRYVFTSNLWNTSGTYRCLYCAKMFKVNFCCNLFCYQRNRTKELPVWPWISHWYQTRKSEFHYLKETMKDQVAYAYTWNRTGAVSLL